MATNFTPVIHEIIENKMKTTLSELFGGFVSLRLLQNVNIWLNIVFGLYKSYIADNINMRSFIRH